MDVFEKVCVPRAVLRNAVPAMAAMLMVLIYNLADTFFIGQTRNDILVAAVSLATPVFLIFMAVGTVFGIGGTSVISRALGEGRPEYAKRVCSFCMWGCVAAGIVLSAAFLLFMDQLLALIGASSDTWEPAKTYLTVVALGGPFVLISSCYSNVIRAEGQSTRAMIGQLLGNLLNVILDPLMILTFGWRIAGAAIATVIGNAAGAGYYILYFLRGKSTLSIRVRDFSMKDNICGGVLGIGVPAALGSLMMSVSQIIVNARMAGYVSTAYQDKKTDRPGKDTTRAALSEARKTRHSSESASLDQVNLGKDGVAVTEVNRQQGTEQTGGRKQSAAPRMDTVEISAEGARAAIQEQKSKASEISTEYQAEDLSEYTDSELEQMYYQGKITRQEYEDETGETL